MKEIEKSLPNNGRAETKESSTLSENIFDIPRATPNFRTALAAQLAELIPEAVADGKLDIEKLRTLLADDVAKESNERFGLVWPGKKQALRAAQEPTTATLNPDFAHSKEWDTTQNVFIEGDNLEVLKTLQRHYHNQIKLIYIDPPYNTGKDFVYKDKYAEGLDTYLEWTRQANENGKVSTNNETEGRYHSNWLNMMYPRLKLARNLLADDGVIFISIDDNEQDNLKKLCNEIMGEGNFVGQLTWESTTQPDNIGSARFGLQKKVEYILFYSRNIKELKPFTLKVKNREDKSYPHTGKFGKCRFEIIERSYDGAYARPTMRFKILGRSPRDGKQWQIGKETAQQLESEGKLEIVDGIIKRAVYPEDDRVSYVPFWSHLTSNEVGTSQKGKAELYGLMEGNIGFETVKPIYLIRTLMQYFPDDSLILDFFAGSATTAHAVMQLNAEDGGNRRFIMVQLPEPTPEGSEARKAGFKTIADISRRRIELAGEKIHAEHPDAAVDIGFRAYTLADTNFARWRVNSDIEPHQLERQLAQHDNASNHARADDVLTELLLKLGYSLTETITPQTIAGLEVRRVGENRVLAYLDENTTPTLEQLRALVDAAPAKLIVLESAFHDNDELKINLAQYAKTRGIELWTA